MNLRQRLIIAFGFVALVPLVGGALGLGFHYLAVQEGLRAIELQHEKLDASDLARAAQVAFKIQGQEWENLLLHAQDQARSEKHLAGFTAAESDVVKNINQLKPHFADAQVSTDKLDKLLSTHAGIGKKYREALAASSPKEPDFATKVGNLVLNLDDQLNHDFDALNGEILAQANRSLEESTRHLNEGSRIKGWILGGGTVVGVLLGILFGVYTTINVNKHIASIATRMLENTGNLSRTADQLALSSQSLADASSSQAASLEETSASLEQIASTISQNADSSAQARELSSQNRKATDTGATELDAMQGAMKEIETSSSNIAKIVKSIDEIAFQTNILALNAAVEAARAGEAGAGFAVVAEEVRALAQRSAQASRETATLIEEALAKSHHGVSISERIAATLRQVIQDTRKVDELIANISTASAEQASGIKQINTAIHQIDKVTQNNTSSSAETASAAKELTSQTELLRKELSGLLDNK